MSEDAKLSLVGLAVVAVLIGLMWWGFAAFKNQVDANVACLERHGETNPHATFMQLEVIRKKCWRDGRYQMAPE